MLIIGLTGSIGMGKSTAAERFRYHGIPVFDSDREVHKLYSEPDFVAKIEAEFPSAIVDGTVDRSKLSELVIGHARSIKRLEEIVHPAVRAAQGAFIMEAHDNGADMVVLEIPLLFETEADARVDVVIVVSAPADIQKERVLQRPGMTEEKFASILAKQVPDSEKRKRADFVVDTSGKISETQDTLDKLIESLRQSARSVYAGGSFYTRWLAGEF